MLLPLILASVVVGTTTIKTTTCTLTANGYTRDEGTPERARHRFVVYAVGCGLKTIEAKVGETRLGFTSSGELQADQAGTFLITTTPSDPEAREAFAERRAKTSEETPRTLMVFVLPSRIEVIVEDLAP